MEREGVGVLNTLTCSEGRTGEAAIAEEGRVEPESVDAAGVDGGWLSAMVGLRWMEGIGGG